MDLEPIARVILAAALGVPIGLDRELRGKAAGLRTHALVASACAALGAVSVLAAPLSVSGADGTRIAAQVVSGIGFIGAGVIFASQGRARGLTTAASLFSVAAVGLCAGLGQEELSVGLAVVTLAVLWPLDLLTDRLVERRAQQERHLQVVARDLAAMIRVQRTLAELETPAREVRLTPFGEGVSAVLLVRCHEAQGRLLLARLAELEGVDFVSDETFALRD